MRIFLFALLFFGIPLALFAQGFTPLTTDFPILSTENASFSSVLNIFLNVVIGIAAVLAVIKIAIGGFKYMGTESFSSKGEAKEDITNAVIGLIIVLAAVFILNIINPDLIKLDVFRNTESEQFGTGRAPTDGGAPRDTSTVFRETTSSQSFQEFLIEESGAEEYLGAYICPEGSIDCEKICELNFGGTLAIPESIGGPPNTREGGVYHCLKE